MRHSAKRAVKLGAGDCDRKKGDQRSHGKLEVELLSTNRIG
jgi:hypothetical protein